MIDFNGHWGVAFLRPEENTSTYSASAVARSARRLGETIDVQLCFRMNRAVHHGLSSSEPELLLYAQFTIRPCLPASSRFALRMGSVGLPSAVR